MKAPLMTSFFKKITKRFYHWCLTKEKNTAGRSFKLSILLTTLYGLFSIFQVSAETGIIAPTKVTVGTYLNQIFNVDFKHNDFSVDFYIWFIWQGDKVNPIRDFELVNGRIKSKDILSNKLENGVHHASAHITANIYMLWDVKNFPYDDQSAAIIIEDSVHPVEELLYEIDRENSAMSKSVYVQGWNIKEYFQKTEDHIYHTNFGEVFNFSQVVKSSGDETLKKKISSYSRYIFGICLKRSGFVYFFKIFITLFISGGMALLVIALPIRYYPSRFNLSLGAIFTAIGNRIFTISNIPETTETTLADKLSISTIVLIFFVIFSVVISSRLWEAKKFTLATLVNRVCAIIFTFFYLLCWIIFPLTV